VIRRRRDGYQVIVYAGIDPVTGRQRQISRQVKGKREAERLEGKLRAEVADGRHRGTAARTVAALLDAWLAWRQASGKPISPHTVNDYRGLIERKLKPGLGKLRLSQLDTQRLDRFYAELRKGGNARTGGGALSDSRVRDVHAILSGALGLAARYGWIAFNPALLARPPAQQSTTRTVPTPEEVRELLAAAADEPDLEMFLRLAATTGLRPGELCALRWVDLDLQAAEVRVTGNLVHAKGVEGGYVRKPPKSAHGVRVLALDPRTVELLGRHRAHCMARAYEWGGEFLEDGYVFSVDEAGRRPIRRDTMTRRYGGLAARLGHHSTLYGLRHFMATQLGAVAETGTVRGRMGHGSLAVTSIYTHRVADADRTAARHMGDLLDRDGGKRR
jgi:integrase